ncbi:MAG TPA: hypothetical protein VK206_17760 [Anaerolineales bacterium]|nr:hypothetical protein [Anaerolineales bacterium]HLO30953.1 hypothetical protein [Anaerolineales bacterium]
MTKSRDKVSILNFQNSDLFSKWFFTQDISPQTIGLAVLIFNLVTNISLAFKYNVWETSSLSIGYRRDFASLAVDFIAEPLIIIGFLWIQRKANALIHDLKNSNKIKNFKISQDILTEGAKRFSSRNICIYSIILSILGMGGFVMSIELFPTQAYPAWHINIPAIFWFRNMIGLPFYFFLSTFLFDLIIIVSILNRLANGRSFIIEPFHNDKAGGLSSIGQFASNLGYILLIVGIFIFLFSLPLFTDYNPASKISNLAIGSSLMIFAYLLFSPFLFLFPLYSIHKAMEKYKQERLDETSKELNNLFQELRKIYSDDSDKVKLVLERINQLEDITEKIERFPVWPFNITNLRKFVGLASAPLITGILSWGLDLVFSLFRK